MDVAVAIRKGIAAGLTMKVILDDIQKYPGAPISMAGMYRTYRSDIAEARASIQQEMGNIVMDAARKGDWKAAEFFLRSKAGWSPTITVAEVEPEDAAEQSGAIEDLLALLNLKDKETSV
jgi:hypothetical protein